MYRLSLIVVPVVLPMLAGCTPGRLLPARDAKTVVGAPTAAVSTDNGIRLSADAADWNGGPEEVPAHVTPMKVRIVNHSGKPIRLLYQEFALQGADDGQIYRPLPLFPLQDLTSGAPTTGAVLQPIRPIFASDKFFVASRYHDAYPTLLAWPTELPRDRAMYGRQYKAWGHGLPTREMRRLGLPEGVLADGGEIAGFLYFQDVTGSEKRLRFKADLNDGDDDEAVASVDIPFRVE